MVDPGLVIRSPRPRTEPTSSTMADLVALVVGAALALSLEWYSGWASQLDLGGTSPPRWYVVNYYLMEGLQKGLLALIPVIVYRRARYGGPIRPAEFLALSEGVPRLLLSLERLPALGLVTRAPGSRIHYQFTSIELLRLWDLAHLVVSLSAVALAARFRRRLAPAITGGLLLGAWLALAQVEFFVQWGRDAVLEWARLPYWGARSFNDLLLMPFLVLWLVPMVLAIIDALRTSRARRTWVERASLWLALILFVSRKLKYYGNQYVAGYGLNLLDATINLAEFVVAAVLCVLIVRRFGPGLGRWFGLIDPPQPEASEKVCPYPDRPLPLSG